METELGRGHTRQPGSAAFTPSRLRSRSPASAGSGHTQCATAAPPPPLPVLLCVVTPTLILLSCLQPGPSRPGNRRRPEASTAGRPRRPHRGEGGQRVAIAEAQQGECPRPRPSARVCRLFITAFFLGFFFSNCHKPGNHCLFCFHT